MQLLQLGRGALATSPNHLEGLHIPYSRIRIQLVLKQGFYMDPEQGIGRTNDALQCPGEEGEVPSESRSLALRESCTLQILKPSIRD